MTTNDAEMADEFRRCKVESRPTRVSHGGLVYKVHGGSFDWMYVMLLSHLTDEAIGGLVYHHCIA